MPSHSKLTCNKIFRGLLRVIPFRCPSVASRNPFAPFLDPVHVPHVRSFWLSWTPYEDPRGSCGNILRNSLLIPYFTVDRPSRILRSDFTYPVRRTGISPFLALRSWPFFEQEHRACGKTTGLATHLALMLFWMSIYPTGMLTQESRVLDSTVWRILRCTCTFPRGESRHPSSGRNEKGRLNRVGFGGTS